MNKTVKFSDKKVFGQIAFLLQPCMIAIIVVAFLYMLIFWSLNKGVSIDEGYYLLGYLSAQQIGPAMSDFHNIVRTVFSFIPEDAVLSLRISRVIITIIALLFFLRASRRWLNRQYNIRVDRLLYFSLGLLSGTMCFAYASPVIYYDNIQLIIYLFVFALFFETGLTAKAYKKYLFIVIIGFLLVFSLTNYASSGLFISGMILLLLLIYNYPSLRKVILAYGFIFIGLIVGILIYSLFINDFFGFFEDAFWAFSNSAKSAKAKYDTGGQLLVFLNYFKDLAITYAPLLILILAYLFFIRKQLVNRIILNIGFGLMLVYFTYRLSGYFTNLLLFPIVLLAADTMISMFKKKEHPELSKNLVFILLLLALPIFAVAGSNQRLEMKMIYFMPFWFLAYFMLLVVLKKYLNPKQIPVFHYSFIITFFIIFFSQGFLKHIHYNYSIKRSTHLIENAERLTNIGVSEYQQGFYENGIEQLKKAGFKPGDEVLAFYETFMLVYAAGGYVPHRLTYSAEFFVASKDNLPPQKADFMIINEYQIPMIEEFLADTDWNFPDGYNRVELGTDGQNLTNMGYNYILFSTHR